jgi:hypothetical protein
MTLDDAVALFPAGTRITYEQDSVRYRATVEEVVEINGRPTLKAFRLERGSQRVYVTVLAVQAERS